MQIRRRFFMKRIIAIILGVLFVFATLTGCSERDEDDKGPVIPVYFTDEVRNYDPIPMIYDEETVINSGILFEGLTYIDAKGKVQKGVAVDWYTKIDEERGEYFLFFELDDETGWDDRRTVQADDFVYAWRRVLSPSTNSPAACLLYNIKNAKEFKSGIVTADDLGIYAESATLLKVEFTGPFDLDLFLENVASPSLVPLREDLVSGREGTWATTLDNFAANGAFTLKGLESGKKVTFQRNTSYERDPDSDTNEWKSVKTHKFTVDFEQSEEDRLARYEDKMLFYIGSFSKEAYDEYEKKIDNEDLMSTYTYFFNTAKAPFDVKEVRQALSIALDREEIAEIAGKGERAATGFVPYGVHDTKTSNSFRKKGGEIIDTEANLEEAKALLKTAGIKASDYSFELRVNADDADKAIAEYVKGVWEELGFEVKIVSRGGQLYTNALYAGDFDVIALDYQALTTDAFSVLAPFARAYSGSVIKIGQDTNTTEPHITGFDNKEYNALIDEIFAIVDDNKNRTKLLHEAEELLVDECPVIPLLFNVSNTMMSGKLNGVETSKFGYLLLEDATLSGYRSVLETLNEEEAAAKEAAKLAK